MKSKYIDWIKLKQIVNENPNSIIYAGLQEDWENTRGLVYAAGKYYKGLLYDSSTWGTPALDVNGKMIECWSYEETKWDNNNPDWWLNELDFSR